MATLELSSVEIIWKSQDGSSSWLSRSYGDDTASFCEWRHTTEAWGKQKKLVHYDDKKGASVFYIRLYKWYCFTASKGKISASFVAHFMVILLETAWTPRLGHLLCGRCNKQAALCAVGQKIAAFPAHLTNIKQSSATRYWIWLNYRARRGSRTAAGS
jgi:hypothetical protein